jgi:TPR repeat protein
MRLAADQGFSQADCNLGVIYENGAGVDRDPAEAVRLYRLAAEKGNAQAQCNLGMECVYGKNVPRDPVEALAWFMVSANSGYSRGIVWRDEMSDHLGPAATAAAETRSKQLIQEIDAGEKTAALAEANATALALKGAEGSGHGYDAEAAAPPAQRDAKH